MQTAEEARSRKERTQHRVELIAAIFLVPTLVVGFYDANTWVPGQGRHWGCFLAELWRQIAWSVLISNTDDHLRSHGFLRASSAGWSLSPAFDINPDPGPGPKYLATAIDFNDPTASIENLLGVAPYFRLTEAAQRLTGSLGS